MATELCTACGCGIVNLRTPAGPAVRHSAKLYCAECAALILSPEDLARLSKPSAFGTSARAPGSQAKMKAVEAPSTDEAIGDEAPPEPPEEESSKRASPSRLTTARTGARPSSRRETSSVGSARSARGQRRNTSVVGNRESSVIDAREKARGGKSETPRARQRAANNNLMYIVMGVAGVALCALVYFVFLRDTHQPKKPTVAAVPDDSDKTSSTEYARRAEDFKAKNDNIHAAEMYRKAADKAEREKNTDQARIYSMKIVSLEKGSTIKSLDGGK